MIWTAMKDICDIIRKRLEEARSEIAVNIEKNGKSASGKTLRSLTVETDGKGRGVLSGLETLVYMERGRRPGEVPSGFVDIIAEWILKKGITVTPIQYVRAGNHKYSPEERGLYSMAGSIAYSIAKKGDRLFRSGKRNDIYGTAVSNAARDIGDEVLNEFGLEVEQLNKGKNGNGKRQS